MKQTIWLKAWSSSLPMLIGILQCWLSTCSQPNQRNLFQILPVNDAPTIKSTSNLVLASISTALNKYFLPHVPKDISSYEGFNVEDLVANLFEDKDDSSLLLGIGVLGAQYSADMGKRPFRNHSWWGVKAKIKKPPPPVMISKRSLR